MKYAVLGDIHSNWEALSVVLDDAVRHEVDAYVSVGDIVGYGADPAKCLAALRKLDCTCVRGNHDHFCAYPSGMQALSQIATAAIVWTCRQLDAKQLLYLSRLEKMVVHDSFTLVHNTLDNSDEWKYPASISDAEDNFALQTTQICFCGHTHVPVVFEKHEQVSVRHFKKEALNLRCVTSGMSEIMALEPDSQYLINVGSVGQPRDRDPRAAYMIYDSLDTTIELHRLPYDIESTRRKITEAKLPQWLGARLGVGK